MNCEPSYVTNALEITLAGLSAQSRVARCKSWLVEIIDDCPDNQETWRAFCQCLIAQIEANLQPILISVGDVSGGTVVIAPVNQSKEVSIVANPNPESPVLAYIVFAMFILALVSIAGGIVAIIWNTVSPTTFEAFGVKLSTGHVGVAFTGIGLVMAYFTFKRVLDNVRR